MSKLLLPLSVICMVIGAVGWLVYHKLTGIPSMVLGLVIFLWQIKELKQHKKS